MLLINSSQLYLREPPLPLSVLLFERAAIFTTAAKNVGDFRNETCKHCLQTTSTSRSDKHITRSQPRHSSRPASLTDTAANETHVHPTFPRLKSHTFVPIRLRFRFLQRQATTTTSVAAILDRSAMLFYRFRCGYLFPCSFLYAPPYLLRVPRISMISGMKLANIACTMTDHSHQCYFTVTVTVTVTELHSSTNCSQRNHAVL